MLCQRIICPLPVGQVVGGAQRKQAGQHQVPIIGEHAFQRLITEGAASRTQTIAPSVPGMRRQIDMSIG